MCEGFEPLILTHPFKLEKIPNQDPAELVWGIGLKNNDIFHDTKFKIKIIDKNGNPVVGKIFEVSPIREDLGLSSRSSIPVETNENGYISLWHSTTENGITTEYLDLVTFELNEKYNLYVIDEKGNYKVIGETINTDLYELIF